MTRGRITGVVVDADVARSSGSSDGLAAACRTAMEAIRETGLTVNLPPGLRKEWDKHQSSFARKWLHAMKSRRLLNSDDVPQDQPLRKKILRWLPPKVARAATKDAHLVEAAFGRGDCVVSRDEVSRSAFGELSKKDGRLRRLRWANPESAECAGWLRRGAPGPRAFALEAPTAEP
jgi:hypothetical protein